MANRTTFLGLEVELPIGRRLGRRRRRCLVRYHAAINAGSFRRRLLLNNKANKTPELCAIDVVDGTRDYTRLTNTN